MKLPKQNPRIPEGINQSATHPLRELLLLGTGICAALLLAGVIVWKLLTTYTEFIPLSWERHIAPQLETATEYQRTRQQLQTRLNRLLAAMNFDQTITVPVNIIDEETANAFAMPGPQIIVTTGLLDDVKSVVGLDMVLAHEAAHIAHRDPIRTLAGTLGIQLLFGLVSGDSQISNLTGFGSHLLLLNYSRAQETAADDLALKALYQVHGTLAGADEFFQHILTDSNHHELPEFLSSHPHTQERIEHIRDFIRIWSQKKSDASQ